MQCNSFTWYLETFVASAVTCIAARHLCLIFFCSLQGIFKANIFFVEKKIDSACVLCTCAKLATHMRHTCNTYTQYATSEYKHINACVHVHTCLHNHSRFFFDRAFVLILQWSLLKRNNRSIHDWSLPARTGSNNETWHGSILTVTTTYLLHIPTCLSRVHVVIHVTPCHMGGLRRVDLPPLPPRNLGGSVPPTHQGTQRNQNFLEAQGETSVLDQVKSASSCP